MTKRLVNTQRMVNGHPFLFLFFLATAFSTIGQPFSVVKNRVLLNQKVSITSFTSDQKAYLLALSQTVDLFLLGSIPDNIEDKVTSKPYEAELVFFEGIQAMMQKNQVKALLKLKRAYHLHRSFLIEDSTNALSLKSVAIFSIILNEMNQYNKFAGTLIKAEWSNDKSWLVLQELKKDSLFALEISLLEVLLYEFVLYDYDHASTAMLDLLKLYDDNKFINYLAAIIFSKNKASKRALTCLNKVNEAWSEYHYILAKNHYYLLNDSSAKKHFKLYLKQSNPLLVDKSIQYLQLLGDKEQSVVNNGSSLKKETLGVLFNYYRLFDAGEFSAVLEGLDKFKSGDFLGDQKTWYYYLRARSYQYLGQNTLAKVEFLDLLYKCDFTKENYIVPFSCYQVAKLFLSENKKGTSLKYIALGLKYKKYPHQGVVRVKMNQLKLELND